MSNGVSVRVACESDLEWVLGELHKFSEFFESEYSFIGTDKNYMIEMLRLFYRDHVFYVAESAGKLLGFVIGFITPHIYNPAIVTLQEAFWWVAEEHRNSRAGLMLLNEFVKAGKERAKLIIFTLEDKSPVNERCLLKRGFKRKETNYFMGV